MRLVFVNFVGSNFKGDNLYEFLFSSNDLNAVTGEDWDSYPANGSPRPPIEYVEQAYKLETEIVFELIQNHVSFDMSDCKQGIIAMAWEAEKDESSVYDKRLFFKFGETLDNVKSKLYENDLFIEKIYGKEKQSVDRAND
jgi:hypothetical protein